MTITRHTDQNVRDCVSAAEWTARIELAACYRLVDRFRYTDLIYNHITRKVPETDHFLINGFGLHYSEITASSLHKIDIDGNIVLRGSTEFGINHAGYVIHAAVHRARPDVHCVLHTHTQWDVALSALQCGLLPISQTALRFQDRIGYHDYEGPATDEDEQQRIIDDLASNDVLVLRNHGALVCGRTVGEGFHLLQRFQVACQVQLNVMRTGAAIVEPSVESQARTHRAFHPQSADSRVSRTGDLEWRAMLRLLDRDDISYQA